MAACIKLEPWSDYTVFGNPTSVKNLFKCLTIVVAYMFLKIASGSLVQAYMVVNMYWFPVIVFGRTGKMISIFLLARPIRMLYGFLVCLSDQPLGVHELDEELLFVTLLELLCDLPPSTHRKPVCLVNSIPLSILHHLYSNTHMSLLPLLHSPDVSMLQTN